MHKLCLNSRDQLLIIDLGKVAYFQANGNYTKMTYIGGVSHLLSIGLTKVEAYVRQSWPKDIGSPFIRLGRSLIINQSYLIEINVLRQRIILSDRGEHSYALAISKPLLKKYKENINQYYLSQQAK